MKTWRLEEPCIHSGYEVGDEVLRMLREKLKIEKGDFVALDLSQTMNYFKVIVATIVSQNTSEKNTYRAFEALERRIGVECNRLAQVSVEEIAEAIRPAGLYAQKAQAIKSLALLLRDNFGCQIEGLLREGPGRAREELRRIRGIGLKTIDVLLASYGYPVMPIDTHVRRVSLRIGLALPGSYEKMQSHLHGVFREEKRLEAHLLLIKLGRTLCSPRSPKCNRCPLLSLCCYARTMGLHE
jgi:endonuclease-3